MRRIVMCLVLAVVVGACGGGGGSGETATETSTRDSRPLELDDGSSARKVISGDGTDPAATGPATPPPDTPTTRKITIVQNASTSDADIAALRQEVATLRSELAALRQQVDEQGRRIPAPYDSSGIDRRVATLEEQVGVTSMNRKGLTNLWTEAMRSERCVDAIRRNWQSEYAPTC